MVFTNKGWATNLVGEEQQRGRESPRLPTGKPETGGSAKKVSGRSCVSLHHFTDLNNRLNVGVVGNISSELVSVGAHYLLHGFHVLEVEISNG